MVTAMPPVLLYNFNALQQPHTPPSCARLLLAPSAYAFCMSLLRTPPRMDITEALSALAPAFASQLGPHLRHLAGTVGQTNAQPHAQADGQADGQTEPTANSHSVELATTAAEIRVLLWRAATLRDFR